ncbi:hypothetical protein [Thalassotalea sp. PS06]|uniref:hypothetical protein n=1 Tax=Thalassotalea sp. PS06 TaxID=2594005 RepID=UPI0011632544|nr:hypothetical protein [Thalassotalea sp. PS06]QDP01342.1 hypothetical protein FNC98_08345 [Thalassotalea sp. PS06]
MKLDPFVAEILLMENIDHFTTSDIRTGYILLKKDNTLDSASTRRFIYSELLKLVKKGWLKKVISKKKELTSFIKTDLIDFTVLREISNKKVVSSENVSASKLDALKKRLTACKNDFLICVGEYEAYEEISAEMPEFNSDIQSEYNLLCERQTKLLGKIKRFEIFINQHKT